jgi:GntR family transcriptional regulator/MocR family aminotransferase
MAILYAAPKWRSSMTTSHGIDMTTLLSVARDGPAPIYRQIYASFRARILTGNLRAGEPVPSTRDLARELGISRIPVLEAYGQLLAEGYFEARRGSGTFVASALAPPVAEDERKRMRGERRISANAAALPPYERPTWAERLGAFQLGQPELRAFPVSTWSRLVARHTRSVRVRALQYGDSFGLPALRQSIAAYLRTSRGVRCDAGQIFIVSGSQQALDLSTRVLLDAGDAAWVEEPGYWLLHHVLKAHGCRMVPVPVDEEGLNVALGAKRAHKARVAFVAPSHQSPLGVTMSASRRLELLDWAQRAGAFIVEDDWDSEYRYDAKPVASLQGLDGNARVVYTGTFSKVMFPSLRLGYAVVPPDLVERFAAMRRAMDLCPPYLAQAPMADFLTEGHFARHLRRMRPIYARRRRLLVEALAREIGAEVIGDAAGMHVAMFLDRCRSDRHLAARALDLGVQVSPLSASYLGKPRQGLVLGFGNTPESAIAPAVRKLAQAIEDA